MSIMSFPYTVLIIDDTPDNIDVIAGILRPNYKIKAALNGERGLDIARSLPVPDIILLDVMMPDMDGYEVLRRLQADPLTRSIPVIIISALSEQEDEYKGLELGAVDYITKPVASRIVEVRVRTHLAMHHQSQQLEKKVHERTEELQRTRLEVIRRLGRAAEFRDNETGFHVIRMSHHARLLALAANTGEDWADLLFNAAPMHDIGKIGIPDRILLKPGRLDPQEWEIMKTHSTIGAEIIGQDQSELMRMSRIIAQCHHEKWDGSGYPAGLHGDEIPLAARIVAVADVFDALTSARPYKRAWSVDEACDYIKQQSGKHLDAHLVELFQDVLPDILKIMAMYRDGPLPYRLIEEVAS
jgi:putative two-component system response regulator